MAFEFRSGLGEISIEKLANIVSNLFYPFPDEEYAYMSLTKQPPEQNSKINFKCLIMSAFKQFSHKDTITEQMFCCAMDSIEKYITDESTERFLLQIFQRHDLDRVFNYRVIYVFIGWLFEQRRFILIFEINLKEFATLYEKYNNQKLAPTELNKLYSEMLENGQEQLNFESFKKQCL